MGKTDSTAWQEAIQKTLETNPPARDSDARLYVAVCITLGETSATTLAQATLLVERGDLPSYNYVSRQRRLLQSTRPELRGKSYSARHAKAVAYRDNASAALAAEGRRS